MPQAKTILHEWLQHSMPQRLPPLLSLFADYYM